MKVLLAGATGAIGRATRVALDAAGHEVRCLTRRAESGAGDAFVGDALRAATLEGAAKGCDAVVSALGASVALTPRGRATYSRVDVEANRNLLAEARRAGVGRFVYVGVHSGPGYDHTRYIKAHEAVEELLRASGLSTTTVRPVGAFTAMEEFLAMARRGWAQVMGDGSARTNPIHQIDVAENIVRHLESGPEAVSIGGPDLLTRRQIVETAFEALGKPARISTVPAGLIRGMVPVVRLLHPRMGDLLEFAVEVSTHDGIAPVAGSRSLRDYFLSLAENKQLPA